MGAPQPLVFITSHSVSLWLALLPHLRAYFLGSGTSSVLLSVFQFHMKHLFTPCKFLMFRIHIGESRQSFLYCETQRPHCSCPPPPSPPPIPASGISGIVSRILSSLFAGLAHETPGDLVAWTALNQGERHLPRIEVPMNSKYVDHSTNYLLQS